MWICIHWVNNILRCTEFRILFKILNLIIPSLRNVAELIFRLYWSCNINCFNSCHAICTNHYECELRKTSGLIDHTLNRSRNFNRKDAKIWFIVCGTLYNICRWVVIYEIISLFWRCWGDRHFVSYVLLVAVCVIFSKVL